MSAGKKYGLKEIPFEPTGAGETKYGYVTPKKFELLEKYVNNTIREKKLHVLLINSPQGAGKSSMISEFARKVKDGSYTKTGKANFISNKLLNLEISSYVSDFLNVCTNMSKNEIQNYVKNTKPILRDKISEILSESTKNNDLTVWIIDEFDILADRPEQEQRAFLQFLREIVDQIAKSKEQSIIFIMAHTQQSATNFMKYLNTQHGPFVSRIVDNIDIGYNFSEVKKIIISRLDNVTIKKRKAEDLSPFTEKGLKKIFDLINSLSSASTLTNFRLLERICYNAFIIGEQKKIKVFDIEFLRDIFEKFCPEEKIMESGLSYQTRAAIAELKQNQIQYNEAILNGLVVAILKMRIKGFEVINTNTKYLSILKNERISLALLNIQSKYSKHNYLFTIYLASPNEKTVITSEDLVEINDFLNPLIDSPEQFCNKIIFLYVSNIDVNLENLAWADYPIRINRKLADDLAALSKAVTLKFEDDIPKLLKEFNSEIGPIFGPMINDEINDLTYMPSQRVLDLLCSLYITSFSNQEEHITKNQLKEKEKLIYGRGSRASNSQIKELINLGFAKEEGSNLIPIVPKTIVQFLKMLKRSPLTKDGIKDFFEELAEPLLDLCLDLEIIKIEEELVLPIYLDDLVKNSAGKIIEIKKWIERFDENSVFIKNINLFLDSYENIIENEEEFVQFTIIKNTNYFHEQISDELGKTEKIQDESLVIRDEKISDESNDLSKGKIEIQHVDTSEVKLKKPEEIINVKLKPLEETIIEIIKNRNSITITQLNDELNNLGYTSNINNTVIKLILNAKILLTFKD